VQPAWLVQLLLGPLSQLPPQLASQLPWLLLPLLPSLQPSLLVQLVWLV